MDVVEFATIEVDGSLANPYAALSVVLWTVCLSTLAILCVRQAVRHRRNAGLSVVLFVVAALLTSFAQTLVGSVIYSVWSGQLVDVGFWGGPSPWIAPVVSSVVGVLAWTFHNRLGDRPPPNQPLQPTSGGMQ